MLLNNTRENPLLCFPDELTQHAECAYLVRSGSVAAVYIVTR